MSMSGSSNMMSGSNYGNAYDTSRSRRYLANAGIEIPPEPIMGGEDEKAFHELDGYYYYPHALHEANISAGIRSHQPYQPHRDDRAPLSMANYSTHNPSRVKQEYQHTGFNLPSLSSGPLDAYGRHCGRFEGVQATRGYYPSAAIVHSEINSS
jgi:meiosis-specific transcription factor NDT80